jgi:hypothetical protein
MCVYGAIYQFEIREDSISLVWRYTHIYTFQSFAYKITYFFASFKPTRRNLNNRGERRQTIKTMLKLLFFLLVCCHVQSLPYHYAKNRQRIARGTNSRLSPSISYGLNEAALSKYQAGNQVSFISVS